MITPLSIAILGYLVVQLGIAAWVSRGVQTESDFIVAGRAVGLFLGMLSLFATNFGAETVMGSSAAIADEGLAGGRADPFGYTLCWVLMAVLVAWQLRSRAYVTVNDFYRDRYGRTVEMVVTVIVLPTSLIWAAAQMMAFGQIISVVSDVPVSFGIIVATAIVVVYTFLGGMKSDIWTDAVQAVVLVAGLTALTIFVLSAGGGIAQSFENITPEQLRWAAPEEGFWSRLDTWMVPVLGSLIMQEAVGRLLSMKTAALARRACLIAALMYFVVGCMPVVIGLVGPHLEVAGKIEHRDAFLPDLAQNLLPGWAYVLFIGALVSAIVSTVNSTLLAFATLATQNIILPVKRDLTDRQTLMLTRGLILLSGPVTCWLALGGDTIFEMAQLSSSFGSAGVLVTFFAGLWFVRGGAKTAIAALAAGMFVSILGTFVYDEVWQAPFLTSIGVAAAVYAIGAIFEKGRPLPKASDAAGTTEPAPA